MKTFIALLLLLPSLALADPKAIDFGFYDVVDYGSGTHVLYSIVRVTYCTEATTTFDVYLETVWQDGESTPATIQADRAATVRAWAEAYECPILPGQLFLTDFSAY